MPSTDQVRADETKQNENMTTTQDKTRYTSGPWEVSMLDTVRGPNGEFIADCERTPHCDRPAPPEPECMANARLIAAAPELLDALKTLIEGIEHLDIHGAGYARQVVAKAEGGEEGGA